MDRRRRKTSPISRLWPLIRLLALVMTAGLLVFWYTRPRIDPIAARHALRDSELAAAIAAADHPIERLHWEARRDHELLLRRQSKTYIEAKEAYRQRHGRREPWAYSAWWRLAKAWHSHIIDDFDDISRQLAPFEAHFARGCDQHVYPRDWLERWHLLQLCFRNRDVEFYGYQEEWFVAAVKYLVEDFKLWAPNVCVMINVDDEPRLLLPRDGSELDSSTDKGPGDGQCVTPTFDDQSRRSIWPLVSKICPADSRPQADANAFTANYSDISDLCRAGPDFPFGVLHSPDNMRLTHDAMPIVSTARLSPFSDVLFPSPWRLTERPRYHEADDVDWYTKLPYVYWRGSTTGGWATGERWRFHRQSLVQHLTQQRHRASVNVKFTDVIQCETRACELQNATLPLAERQPLATAWEYKMVLDMDGNGASGRLYDLLQSRSLVLRHAFMREWHDQHLRPWLHYVPLPADYGEVDRILDYFASAQGDRVGKLIADEGRRWANESLRVHEQKLYFMRVVLEMGRDKRPPTW